MADQLIDYREQDVPVYLFTGFLEAGKTQFVQGTLADRRFDTGERTLLIVCEEGEEEYDLSKIRRSKTSYKLIEDEEELTAEALLDWDKSFRPDRVMVEYNGMWMLDTLFQAMPQNWMIQQEFFFADARTFLNYNANMRQLCFDKLRSCDLVVFNRFDRSQDIMPYHKIVRAVNRATNIAYEDPKGKVKYDDIVDPLPFDKKAPVIEIDDRDYALWYQDLGEELKSYDGKTVKFKGKIITDKELEKGAVVVGRQMMNCCAADTTFAGLIATQAPMEGLKNGDWVVMTAGVKVGKHPGYGNRPGPVLTVQAVEPAQAPEEEVATFY